MSITLKINKNNFLINAVTSYLNHNIIITQIIFIRIKWQMRRSYLQLVHSPSAKKQESRYPFIIKTFFGIKIQSIINSETDLKFCWFQTATPLPPKHLFIIWRLREHWSPNHYRLKFINNPDLFENPVLWMCTYIVPMEEGLYLFFVITRICFNLKLLNH